MKNAQVVLITGASSGIGHSTGAHLISRGYQVIGTSRTPEKYPNHPFPLYHLDVRDDVSVKDTLTKIVQEYHRIDVLINNAGMGMAGPVEEIDMNSLDMLMETNFKGPIRIMQHVLPHMHKQQSGRIINIASLAGSNGLPFRSVYSASKAALMRVSESLRLELRHTTIQCTVLSPGSIQTPIAANRFYAPLQKDSVYHDQYKNALSDMDNHVDKGLLPICVAKKIEKLIRKKKLKPHYSIGPFLELISPTLKFLIPQLAYESMLASFYNLK